MRPRQALIYAAVALAGVAVAVVTWNSLALKSPSSVGHVASAADVDARSYGRVYDVGDIVGGQLVPFRATVIYEFPSREIPHKPVAITRDDLDNEIVDLIQDSIAPEQWYAYGGDVGAIVPLEGRMLVIAPADSHRRIQSLLREVRLTPATRSP